MLPSWRQGKDWDTMSELILAHAGATVNKIRKQRD
jgi:hypothetical protein